MTYGFGDGGFSYTWDSRDRLTGISGAPGSSFAYDPLGRRITRTVGGAFAGYVYDGWNVAHNHAAGTINATLLNGLGLDERYARTNAGGTVAFLTDALGSTLHLRSPGGANAATATYVLVQFRVRPGSRQHWVGSHIDEFCDVDGEVQVHAAA